MKHNPYLHPFLIAIFPILFIYTQNAYETDLSEIILPSILALVVVSVLLFLLRSFGIEKTKTSLIVTMLIFSFFIYGHLVHLFVKSLSIDSSWIDPKNITFFLLALFLFVTGVLISRMKKPSVKLVAWLNYFTALLIFIQIIQGGYVLATRELNDEPDDHREVTEELKKIDTQTNPNDRDIFYIILDGYARSDNMKNYYSYDNSSFIDFLKEKGFYVADSSYANYCQTLLSLGSSMNLDYLDKVGDFYHLDHDRMPLAEKLWHNRLFAFLRNRGYEITAFATGLNYTEFKDAEQYLSPKLSLSQYDNILLDYTPLPYLFDFKKDQYDQHRERIDFVFDKLSEIKKTDQPKFIFAHVIAPHPPFVFDSTGSALEADRPFTISDGNGYFQHGGTVDEYVTHYRDQAIYLSKKIQKIVKDILDNYPDLKPIIIVQGDHGPGSRTYWNLVKKTDMHERYGILNAYYLPDFPDSILYKQISPVNSFRMICDYYFDQSYPLLPDSSYFSTFSYPFHFYNVTARLDTEK